MKFDEYISVVLPAFNGSEYLRSAIESILKQTYGKFELIIVNDGSTDDTEDVVKSITDGRIRYFRIEHSGMGKALNYALKNAKYNWIALMDSDDIAHPERFEIELNYKNLALNDVLFPDSVYFKGNKIKFLNTISGSIEAIEEKIRLHGHICMSGVIFNKDFILSNGGFDESLGNSEDYDLWMKIIDKANFIHVDIPLMFVRMRENSMSRDNYKKTKDTLYFIKQKYNLSYPGISAGWNEFFYGSKDKAKYIFSKYLLNPRASIGYLICLMPEKMFNYIIDYKIIPRFRYLLLKVIFLRKYMKIQNVLSGLIQSSSKQGIS